MTREAKVNKFLENAGHLPQEGKAIIVKYAPANLSDQVAKFFSFEWYVMQICKESIVLVPFSKFVPGMPPKKDVALELPLTKITHVSVTEEYMNYRITLDTEEGVIGFSAQQAELSELRSSGTLATGLGPLNLGIWGACTNDYKSMNWHRKNLPNTLEFLKSLGNGEQMKA